MAVVFPRNTLVQLQSFARVGLLSPAGDDKLRPVRAGLERFSQILLRFGEVLRYVPAIVVGVEDLPKSLQISQICGFTVPINGFPRVPPEGTGIVVANYHCRFCVTLIRQFFTFLQPDVWLYRRAKAELWNISAPFRRSCLGRVMRDRSCTTREPYQYYAKQKVGLAQLRPQIDTVPILTNAVRGDKGWA